MKRLFLLITLLLTIPATHTATPLEAPPYVNKKRAAHIRNRANISYNSWLEAWITVDDIYKMQKYYAIYKLKAADALESPSMTNLEKLEAMPDDLYWPDRKEIIKHMIKNGVDINTVIYTFGKTPLYESTELNDFNFTCYLLRRGADSNQQIPSRDTPLQILLSHFGCARLPSDVRLTLLKLLIFNNADPDFVYPDGTKVRDSVNATTQALIKQAEQEKKVRELLLVSARITNNPALIAVNYLYPDFNVSKESIALAEQNIALEGGMLLSNAGEMPVVNLFDEVD